MIARSGRPEIVRDRVGKSLEFAVRVFELNRAFLHAAFEIGIELHVFHGDRVVFARPGAVRLHPRWRGADSPSNLPMAPMGDSVRMGTITRLFTNVGR